MLRSNKLGISLLFLIAVVACLSPTSLPFLVRAEDVDESSVDLDAVVETPAAEAEEEVAEDAVVEEEAEEEVAEDAVVEEEAKEDPPAEEEESLAEKVEEIVEDVKEVVEDVKEAIQEASDGAVELKDNLVKRISSSVKSAFLTKKGFKKVAVAGAGAWGAVTGGGFLMQRYGEGAAAEAVKAR